MQVRADVFFYAIRIYKSRSLASEAIKKGKIKLEGVKFKSSHAVQIGEKYQINKGSEKIIIEVTKLLEKRQKASVTKNYYLLKLPLVDQSVESHKSIIYKKRTAKPTKKERRDWLSYENE